ncbi:hypothetical protein D3C81_1940550 [compost metagenome]
MSRPFTASFRPEIKPPFLMTLVSAFTSLERLARSMRMLVNAGSNAAVSLASPLRDNTPSAPNKPSTLRNCHDR